MAKIKREINVNDEDSKLYEIGARDNTVNKALNLVHSELKFNP